MKKIKLARHFLHMDRSTCISVNFMVLIRKLILASLAHGNKLKDFASMQVHTHHSATLSTMAKARKKATHPTLPLGPPQPTTPLPMPQIGDRVIPERSDSEWKITSISASGKYVDLELPGTYLTRFHQDVATLKFTDRVAPKTPEPVHDTSAIFERISAIQRENLQRLDDDIAILTKYLKTEGASREVMEALETLSNEQHASWQAAVQRIEELIGDD
jgi:hypothetical protein